MFLDVWLWNKGWVLRDFCVFKIDFRGMKWAIQLFYSATNGLASERSVEVLCLG